MSIEASDVPLSADSADRARRLPGQAMNSMRNRKLHQRGNVHVRRQLQGNTSLHGMAGEGSSEPRLPHERDQSADSADSQLDQHRDMARQAADDVNQGMKDTGPAPVLEETNARLNSAPTAKPD